MNKREQSDNLAQRTSREGRSAARNAERQGDTKEFSNHLAAMFRAELGEEAEQRDSAPNRDPTLVSLRGFSATPFEAPQEDPSLEELFGPLGIRTAPPHSDDSPTRRGRTPQRSARTRRAGDSARGTAPRPAEAPPREESTAGPAAEATEEPAAGSAVEAAIEAAVEAAIEPPAGPAVEAAIEPAAEPAAEAPEAPDAELSAAPETRQSEQVTPERSVPGKRGWLSRLFGRNNRPDNAAPLTTASPADEKVQDPREAVNAAESFLDDRPSEAAAIDAPAAVAASAIPAHGKPGTPDPGSEAVRDLAGPDDPWTDAQLYAAVDALLERPIFADFDARNETAADASREQPDQAPQAPSARESEEPVSAAPAEPNQSPASVSSRRELDALSVPELFDYFGLPRSSETPEPGSEEPETLTTEPELTGESTEPGSEETEHSVPEPETTGAMPEPDREETENKTPEPGSEDTVHSEPEPELTGATPEPASPAATRQSETETPEEAPDETDHVPELWDPLSLFSEPMDDEPLPLTQLSRNTTGTLPSLEELFGSERETGRKAAQPAATPARRRKKRSWLSSLFGGAPTRRTDAPEPEDPAAAQPDSPAETVSADTIESFIDHLSEAEAPEAAETLLGQLPGTEAPEAAETLLGQLPEAEAPEAAETLLGQLPEAEAPETIETVPARTPGADRSDHAEAGTDLPSGDMPTVEENAPADDWDPLALFGSQAEDSELPTWEEYLRARRPAPAQEETPAPAAEPELEVLGSLPEGVPETQEPEEPEWPALPPLDEKPPLEELPETNLLPHQEPETVPMDLNERSESDGSSRPSPRDGSDALTLEDFLAAAVPVEAKPDAEAEPAAENRRGNLREQTLSFGAANPQTISTAPENPAGLILTWSDDETEGKTEAGDPGTEPGERRPGAWAQSVGPTEQEPEAGARSSEHIEQEPPAGKQKKIVSLFGWRRKAQDRKSSRGGAFVRGAKTGAGSAGSLTGSGLEGAAVLASEAEALGGAVMGAALGAASADQASAPAKAPRQTEKRAAEREPLPAAAKAPRQTERRAAERDPLPAAAKAPRQTEKRAAEREPVPSADIRAEAADKQPKHREHQEIDVLPPEEKSILHPDEAYRVYAKPLDSIGSRLILTGLFSLLSLFFTLYLSQRWTFLPEIFSGGTTVYIMLALLGLMVLVNRKLYFRDWRDETGLRPGLLIGLATIFTALDCISAAKTLRPPFTVVVGGILLVALWGQYDRGLALTTTVKVLRAEQLSTGVGEVQDITKGSRGLIRTKPDVDRFMEKLETRDLTDRLLRIYTPVAAAVGLVLTLTISLVLKREFFWTGALVFLGIVPVTGLLAFPRLFCLLARRLAEAQAALCGYHGAEVFGGEHSILIGDDDVFPAGSLTLNGFKVYNGNPDRMIAYAAAACRSSGSALDPIFEDLLVTHNGRHYTVDNFRFYDSGGIGASIQQDVVLMGSLDFMRRMGVHMDRGARVKQAVYMSLNGELAAVFAVRYNPPENLRRGLAAIAGNRHFKGILVTRTFLGTPGFLKAKFGISTGAFAYPSTKERIRLSEAELKRSGTQGAILAKNSFSGFAQAVAGGRLLRSATLGAAILTVLGGLTGLVLMGVLAAMAAYETATALNLLLYAAAWLVPTLLLTAWVRHF